MTVQGRLIVEGRQLQCSCLQIICATSLALSSLLVPLLWVAHLAEPISGTAIVCNILPLLSAALMRCRYMDKGRDCIEQGKFYARLLGALGKAGLRV